MERGGVRVTPGQGWDLTQVPSSSSQSPAWARELDLTPQGQGTHGPQSPGIRVFVGGNCPRDGPHCTEQKRGALQALGDGVQSLLGTQHSPAEPLPASAPPPASDPGLPRGGGFLQGTQGGDPAGEAGEGGAGLGSGRSHSWGPALGGPPVAEGGGSGRWQVQKQVLLCVLRVRVRDSGGGAWPGGQRVWLSGLRKDPWVPAPGPPLPAPGSWCGGRRPTREFKISRHRRKL